MELVGFSHVLLVIYGYLGSRIYQFVGKASAKILWGHGMAKIGKYRFHHSVIGVGAIIVGICMWLAELRHEQVLFWVGVGFIVEHTIHCGWRFITVDKPRRKH